MFSPSQRRVNHSFSLSLGGQPLTQSNVKKLFGVYLDEHLTWKHHINFVCKQMAKSVGILSRTRFYLSCKTNLMLYYTLEQFSFECRKVIGFAFTTLRDWFKKLAPLFHPIRSKTKTNRDSLACVFPRFVSATCNYFAF